MKLLVIVTLLLTLAGCSSTPPDETGVERIKAGLRRLSYNGVYRIEVVHVPPDPNTESRP